MRFLVFMTCCFAVLTLSAKEFFLVENGIPRATIVIAPDFTTQEAYAAAELSAYLEKLTGARVPVSLAPAQGRYPVYLTRSAARLPRELAAKFHQVKDDGFLISATDKGLHIAARRPLGVLYGTYEILKNHGGIRWIFPGEDGESYETRRSFSVPPQLRVVNPSFRIRTFNLTGGPPGEKMLKTLQWQLRNNMQPAAWFQNEIRRTGGHDFWTLMPKELFQTRPELFPMVNGKRVPPSGKAGDPGYSNPCVSNPETMKIICDTIIRKLSADRSVNRYEILQNDTMQWCECENCRKLDSPEERLNKQVSNRFWIYANTVINAVKKAIPQMEFQSMAYINAENPPDRVKPDPRLDHLKICLVRRCYTHSIGDASCAVNRSFRERVRAWRKLGYPVTTYEYSLFIPQGNQIYNPLEGIYVKDLKYYKSSGLAGYCDERPPMVDEPERFFIRSYLPTLGNSWKYDAIPRYIQAYFLWNADADFDEVMEDVGSRYYAKAWPQMKEYRKLLRRCYENSGTHFLYGSPNIALGRCLEDKDAHRKLRALLEQAFRSARGDGKTLARLRLEKEGFDGWELRRKEYEKLAGMTAGAGKISGEPEEKDWEKAPAVTDFRSSGKKALQKTSVKALWSPRKLYFRIRAEEPSPRLMVTRKTERDDQIWLDNSLELFLAAPALGGKYLHLVTNADGVFFDAMTLHATDSDIAFDSGSEIGTHILPDAWIADIAIPFSALGGAPKPGDRWKVNIARSRKLSDNTAEISSWSNGVFHGADSYRTLEFQK